MRGTQNRVVLICQKNFLPDFEKIVFKIEKWRVDLEQKKKKEIVYFIPPIVFSQLFIRFIHLCI